MDAAESAAIETVTALSTGTFDYQNWCRQYASACERSALTFLARLRQPIPDGVDLDGLKKLATEKLDLFTARGSRTQAMVERDRQILFDYYGLGGSAPKNSESLAQLHGFKTKKGLDKAMKQKLRGLRVILGSRK